MRHELLRWKLGSQLSHPGFWDPVSEGIRQANPVLVTNCFKEKVLLKMFKCLKWQNVMF